MTLDDRARRAAQELGRLPVGPPPTIDALLRRRRHRVAAVAVVAVAVALSAAAAWRMRDGDPERVVAGVPETTTTSDGAAATTSTSSPTSGGSAAPTAAARPQRFVAVREDGTLVVIDGGRTTPLAHHGDPRDESQEAPSLISAVALDRHRNQVFFEVCCEPAVGTISRTDLERRREEQVAEGYHPVVSTDGRLLAFSTYTGLAVVDLATGARHDIDGGEGYTPGSARLTWSPDTATLAVEQTAWPEGRSSILVLERQARSLAEGRLLRPPPGDSWTLPVFRGDGRLVVAAQCCWPEPSGKARGVVVDVATGEVVGSFSYEGAVNDQNYDDSGTWLLYVTADGALRWRGGGGTGLVGGGYRNADW